MSSGWKECSLGDLFQIKHGYAFKGAHFGTEGSHIVLTPGNFHDAGGFKKKGEKEKWYSGEVPEDYILSEGDLIVAMTEQAEGLLGSSAIIPEDGRYLHNQRLGLIEDVNGADKHFLYYLFNSLPVRQQIRASCSGVKVRHTSPSRIYEVKAKIPDLPTQRRIAGILSAYDDLIENNLQRIRILEEMAQSLYREWFVHFRIPSEVLQKAGLPPEITLVDSPLGPIPDGWEIRPVNDVCSLKSGYAFKSKDFDKNGEWPLVIIKNVQDRNFIPDCTNALVEVPEKVPDYCYLKDGDLLLSLTGNIGRVCIVFGGNYLLNQRVAKLVPKTSADSGFVYCFFADEDARTRLENIASGVAQQNLSPVQTGKTDIKLPPDSLRNEFASFANKILEQIVVLQRRNQTLRQTLDLLLPKLLTSDE